MTEISEIVKYLRGLGTVAAEEAVGALERMEVEQIASDKAWSAMRDRAHAAESELATLRAQTSAVSTDSWRCFHCNETFTDPDEAKKHFGVDEEWQAGCVDPLTKDEKERRADQIQMYEEIDREREENSRLMNRDYVLACWEKDLAKHFNGAKSVHQAMLVMDEVEGRALATEARLAEAEKLLDGFSSGDAAVCAAAARSFLDRVG